VSHRPCPRPKWWPLRLLWDINRKIDRVETTLEEMMTAQQDQADALAARIDTRTANIRQDIADLKNAHPEVDFSKLEASVGGLENLDDENPPAPENPEPPQV
jgi:hypothetical protein